MHRCCLQCHTVVIYSTTRGAKGAHFQILHTVALKIKTNKHQNRPMERKTARKHMQEENKTLIMNKKG